MSTSLDRRWFATAARSVVLIAAMLLVGVGMVCAKGPPQAGREIHRRGVERPTPHPMLGAVQLSLQLLLLGGATWVCRLGLKIRL